MYVYIQYVGMHVCVYYDVCRYVCVYTVCMYVCMYVRVPPAGVEEARDAVEGMPVLLL